MNDNKLPNGTNPILNLKFIIIGDPGVGKTSLLHHFIFNKYKKDTKQTVNVEYSSKSVYFGEKEIKLQLWDTAGQERYKSVTKSYYKNAVGVIIVYDVTKNDSFNHVINWLNDAKSIAKKDCSICVVGTKCDLKDEKQVKFTDGAKFCQDNGLVFFECSALTGENIEEVFNKTTKSILQKMDDGIIELEEKKISIILKEPEVIQNSTCSGYC